MPGIMSTPKRLKLYGILWELGLDVVRVEQAIIANNYLLPNGRPTGATPYDHWKSYLSALWPFWKWHRWNELMLREYLKHREESLLGPASSGKTGFMAMMALGEWWIAPDRTTVICSTTTIKALERRIFAEINKLFIKAKKLHTWLEGSYMASLPAIVLDEAKKDGRDLRNGIIGVACKAGGEDVGLAEYAGIKNDRVRLFADEGSYMSQAFITGAGNLDANSDFKMVVSGNPNDPTDALGIIAEPHPSEGGWEGVEQTDKTRTWKNRRSGGVTVQLVGTDSPNLDYPEDVEPFPFLIGRRFLKSKEENYGRDSKEFNREARGHMMVGGSRKRVISADFCRTRGATEEPVWSDVNKITKVVGLDASYSAVGGDRTPIVELWFGPDVSGKIVMWPIPVPVIVPIKNIKGYPPEDQIADFAKDYCEKRGIPPDMFGFDGTGRSSLTSSLARRWSPAVNSIEFGGKPSERSLGSKIPNCREKYDRMVSELWFAVREVIDAGQMRGLTDPYIEEGSKREWDEKIGGKQSVVTKEVMKELLGKSPDIFDALVAAVEMARRKGFVILNGDAQQTTRQKLPTWLQQRRTAVQRQNQNSTLTPV